MFTLKKVILMSFLIPVFLFGQSFELSIKNQLISGSEYFFDIYMLGTGDKTIYLANSDLVLTFAKDNFENPSFSLVSQGEGQNQLSNELLYSFATAIINQDRLVVNIMPSTISSDAQFKQRIQELSNAGEGNKLATFKLTGISNPNGYSNLRWRVEAPSRTIINTFEASEPWLQYDISENGSYINPNDIKLPVEITSFKATTNEEVVNLWWNFYQDKTLAGFNIYRKAEKESEYQKINSQLITISESNTEFSYNDAILQPGQNYSYKLEALDINGSRINYGPIEIYVDRIIPKSFLLDQNYPNPFNPTTTISYHLPIQSRVEITIYNSLGQKLLDLVKKETPPGSYNTEWDGKDSSGKKMGSGLYLVRMKAGRFMQVRKMLFLR